MKKLFKKKKTNLKAPDIIGIIAFFIIIIVAGFLAYRIYTQQNGIPQGTVDVDAPFSELSPQLVSERQYNRYKDALAILEDDPTDKAALLNLGYIYREGNELNEAEKAFRRYLDHSPDDPEAHVGLARVYTDRGDFKTAETLYYSIVKTYPFYMLAYEELLDLYTAHKLEPNVKFTERLNAAKEKEGADEYVEQIDELLKTYTGQVQ